MAITIRYEQKKDERFVEEITRKAFWNLFFPGCNEHYLAHLLRSSTDFIPELNYVIQKDNEIIGSIMYTKSCVINEKNESMNTITFGPVSIDPKFQRKGYGSQLIKNSIDKAIENGFSAIIIYGNPMNYCHLGFCSSKRFSISNAEGKYPCGLLVKPLKEKIFENHEWKFYESKSFNVDLKGFEEFDSTFDKIEKEVRYSQEEFWIISNGYLD